MAIVDRNPCQFLSNPYFLSIHPIFFIVKMPNYRFVARLYSNFVIHVGSMFCLGITLVYVASLFMIF